jgi:uncharacterized repeat protein (TIGR03803 family)
VLHTFTGRPNDGSYPYGALVRDRAGNFYGTTNTGGKSGDGTVFKLTTSGDEKILHSFIKAEGKAPVDALILDDAGNLYGTTEDGGVAGGTVFELSKGGKLAPLHRFGQGGIEDGADPWSGLVRDADGNLYGTTAYGGGNGGLGTVYKVDPLGNETLLYAFGVPPDGSSPLGSLLRDAAGNLYGTTGSGGAFCGLCAGTVFKVDPEGKEKVLYSFTGGIDGGGPLANLITDGEGNLYSTTYQGGMFSDGTIFKLDRVGTLTVLYAFGSIADDGMNPRSGIIRDEQGNFYGTTYLGGDHGVGTVYKLDASGVITILHSFTFGRDGAAPFGGLIRDEKGNLYGTTTEGGDPVCNCGVVFEIAAQ